MWCDISKRGHDVCTSQKYSSSKWRDRGEKRRIDRHSKYAVPKLTHHFYFRFFQVVFIAMYVLTLLVYSSKKSLWDHNFQYWVRRPPHMIVKTVSWVISIHEWWLFLFALTGLLGLQICSWVYAYAKSAITRRPGIPTYPGN